MLTTVAPLGSNIDGTGAGPLDSDARWGGLIVLPQKSSRRRRLAIANAGSRLPVGRWFKSAGEAVTRKRPHAGHAFNASFTVP